MAIIEEFLSSILGFLRAKDTMNLQLWLRVEPPLPDRFYQLAQELKQSYGDSNALEQYIEKLLPENKNAKSDEGDIWPGFLAFMKEFLEFWRDVNFDDLLETHNQLSGLVKYISTTIKLQDILIKHPAALVSRRCRTHHTASSFYLRPFNSVWL